MVKNRKLYLLAIVACLVSSLGAQTNSPYSRYGYGILRDQSVGPSRAMGGIGYGTRNGQSANPLNPASYTKADSLTFLFDVGISATQSKFNDGVNKQSDYNGSLDYITMLMPVGKGMGLSFGLLPFSSVGYDYGSSYTTSNVAYTKSYTGSGGFSQLYGGFGMNLPIAGLSAGANVSYLFGLLKYTSDIPYIGGGDPKTSFAELKLQTFKFDIGVQYDITLSPKNKLTLGAVYTPNSNKRGVFDSQTYTYNTLGSLTAIDTIAYNQKVDAGLPATYGLGFSIVRNQKLTLGADVTYQKWSNVKYSTLMGDGLEQNNRFNDKWKYKVGGEYIIDPYAKSFVKRIRFRGGANYGNSYLNVKNTAGDIDGYNEYGATVGFGIPLKERLEQGGRTSYININFEYRKMDPKISNMIKEEYFGVSVNLNINEMWFMRRKIY